MIRSVWTEVSSFIGGLNLAAIIPSIAYDGYGNLRYILTTVVFGLITFVLIYRMIRNRTVALVLAGLGLAYWGGLIAAGLGLAYAFYDGVDERSVGLWAYIVSGVATALVAYRGRAAFDARAGDFPKI